MTKKLEEILDINPLKEEPIPSPETVPESPIISLEEKLEEFDKISAALPRVRGLGDISDAELDKLAKKAEEAYDDIMDLGMQVEPKYSARMFEVATGMLNAAITAKTNKIDKKLKMVDLQLKKLAIDKKSGSKDETVEGEGFILTDRNSILAKLRDLK
jgi:hypothetical protein